MKTIQAMALATGLAVMMPMAAMAQDGGQDIGSRLLAELTGQMELPAVNDLRSDSRRSRGEASARVGDKDMPALVGGPSRLDELAQSPRTAPQQSQAGRIQQAGQTWQTPPPALPLPAPAPAPSHFDAGPDGKGGLDAGDVLGGGKPMTAPAGYYGY